MHILKTPDTILLGNADVRQALAAAVKSSTDRDLAHIVDVRIHDVEEIGSEDHKDVTIKITLKDEK